MELSKRLYSVASMVAPGSIVCDVGCDHGYVSIFLVEKGISAKVYAMDVNKGPLERAREHIKEYGYEEYIEVRLSDGLKEMPAGIADSLICAGMGGRLVVKILNDSPVTVKGLKELVLQPQSEIALVRKYLRTYGFAIVKEDMVEEDGKFYPVILAKPAAERDCRKEQNPKEKPSFALELADKYGPFLLHERHPVLQEFLEKEQTLLLQIQEELKKAGKSEKTKRRLAELSSEIEQTKEALTYF